MAEDGVEEGAAECRQASAVEGQDGVGRGELVVEKDSEGVGEGGREVRGPRLQIKIRVIEFQRTEEDFTYTIEVEVNKGTPLTLHHRYSDMKWLYRLLSRKEDLSGHILPPFPEAPAAAQPHQELLGTPKSSMFGGYSRPACLGMETFLQSLADHPFFSDHHEVHTCLTSEQLPKHDIIGNPSLWASLTSIYSNYQLTSVQDSDEEFVVLLSDLNGAIPVLEACSQDFSQLVTSWQKLACAEMMVGECVRVEGDWEVGRNDACALALATLYNVLNEHQKYDLSSSTDAQNTIGFTFDLLHRYSKQAKDMLYRRLEKVQILINASRQLDRAKPEKKDMAEQARAAAMTDYENINKTAKTEMDALAKRSAQSLRESLVNFAESQVTQSRCLLAQLSSLCSQISIGKQPE